MSELKVKEIIAFVNKCDKDFLDGVYNIDNLKQARGYIKLLKGNANGKNAINRALIDKLNVILKRFSLHCEDTLTLVNDKNNLCEYIINLVRDKHLTDSKLIARFVYIELSKYLYYDISYSKTMNLNVKKIIVNTPINPKTAKVFSYVVCTQWLQLYQYILSKFGIEVKEMTRPKEDHVWGEIDLHNGEIIIVDATDYIGSSIDLSNAKSVSPTRGFLILPSVYSGMKFQEVYTNHNFKSTLNEIMKFYDLNRELDVSLDFISYQGYPVEKILRENELFLRSDMIIRDEQEAHRIISRVQRFFSSLNIPNNMDGYEIFAFYHMFIKKLPINVRGNIFMKTIFADTFKYKQARLRRKYLKPDEEYLKYLQELVYDRYYKYLKSDESNELLSYVKDGLINNEQLSSEILKEEMIIAEINRRLIPYYTINELVIFDPFSLNPHDMYQLYEPATGRKIFRSSEEVEEYKKLSKVL